jgi:WD40 repeat protein
MNPTIRQAIARIDVLRDGQSASRGTGTLVTADLVLTAMHVVADRSAASLSLYDGTITLAFPNFTTTAQVVDRGWNPNADWILLRCVTPPPFAPLPLADSVVDGAPWETYGFPDANPRDGMVQIGTVDNASGSFENIHAFQLFSNQAAAGSGAPVKGLSGGPVVVDGALVAVLRSSLMRDGLNVAGTLYGCPVDLILAATGDLLPVPDPCRGLPGLPRQPLPASPFRFLDRFAATDAEIFFGRNREIRQVRDMVIAADGPSVLLLYGQSGAGKSSFLDAGLLPRLAAGNAVAYLRRDRDKGLLGTLLDGLRAQVPARAGAPSTGGPDALRLAWLEAESAAAKPVLIVLDQVEEVFTQPGDDPNELATLVAAVAGAFGAASRPRGRLILGFRKEWFAEIQKQLEERNVEFAKVFLETLDAAAIVEVIGGLHSTKRLRDRYGLDLEPGLADKIARDLSADSDSPVAPTLQVLLSKMWRAAAAANTHAPRFSEQLYDQLNKDGVLLTDFFDQQLAALQQIAAAAGGTRGDVVTSGLAIDVLVYYTNAFGSAEQHTVDELRVMYAHRPGDAEWVVQEAKGLYLLTDPAGDGVETRNAARLSHDTLAHVVRARYEVSGHPGSRARRILENRAGEWSGARSGVPLDARDLGLVEQGLSGMRQLTADELRLLHGSREEVRRQQRGAAYRRWAAAAAVVAILIAGGVAAWLDLVARRQQQWSALFALDALVPVLLDIEPVNGLVAAVDAADRNLELNQEVLLPGTRGNLVRALAGARERVAWRLEVAATAVDAAPDDRIAVGTHDGMVRVFRADGADDIPPIRAAGAGTTVRSVAFSADGEWIAAAMDSQGLGVWSRRGRPLSAAKTPDLPLGRATAVQFSPDGHILVAAFASDNRYTLYVCDIDAGTAIARPIAVKDPVATIATARTAAGRLVIATAGGEVRIWTDSGALVWQPDAEFDGAVTSVDIVAVHDPAPRILIAAGSSDGSVQVWGGATKRPYLSYRLAAGKVVLAFGYQGRLLHAGASDDSIHTFDLARNNEAIDPIVTAGDPEALTASADGKRVVTVAVRSVAAFVQVFDLAGTQLVFPLSAPQFATQDEGQVRLNDLVFAGPDTIVGGSRGRSIPRWSVKARPFEPWAEDQVTAIDAGQDETTAVASDASGRMLVLAGTEKVVFLAAGARVEGSQALPAPANDAAISPDGTVAAVGSSDGSITVWDTATGRLVRSTKAHTGDIWSVAFNVSGTLFASGGADFVIRIWNADGSPSAEFKRAGNIDSTALAFHPDGSIFSGDTTGRVERLSPSGKVLTSSTLFRSEIVNEIVIDAKGETVFIAGPPGIRVLDPATGSILSLRFPRVAEKIGALALRSDGALLAGATERGEVLLWRANWNSWLAEACNRLSYHPVFRSLSGPVAGAPSMDTHGVDYAAAYRSCATRVQSQESKPPTP